MWAKETLYPDWNQGIKGELVYQKKTGFQDLRIYDTERFGKMLMLDGAVQTTEKDEFIYHEMITHPVLLLHPRPKKVLIIGGGDGGVLREVLKYKSVEQATMVEIDPDVIELSRKYLPSISKKAFNSKRARIIIADGAKFVKETGEKFDIVITDSPDPVGPARILFSRKFYRDIDCCLAEKGMMIAQTGSTFTQAKELKAHWKLINDIFAQAWLHCAAIPTYVGGFFTLTVGSKAIDLQDTDLPELEKKWASLGLKTNYFNPYIHIASALLPEYVRRLLE